MRDISWSYERAFFANVIRRKFDREIKHLRLRGFRCQAMGKMPMYISGCGDTPPEKLHSDVGQQRIEMASSLREKRVGVEFLVSRRQ